MAYPKGYVPEGSLTLNYQRVDIIGNYGIMGFLTYIYISYDHPMEYENYEIFIGFIGFVIWDFEIFIGFVIWMRRLMGLL